jgi:hypothetical protein
MTIRKCELVDQDAFKGNIVERIEQRSSSAELVIADITGNIRTFTSPHCAISTFTVAVPRLFL